MTPFAEFISMSRNALARVSGLLRHPSLKNTWGRIIQ